MGARSGSIQIKDLLMKQTNHSKLTHVQLDKACSMTTNTSIGVGTEAPASVSTLLLPILYIQERRTHPPHLHCD